MSMQNEECISLKRDMIDVKKELGLLNRKYQNVLKRLHSLSSTESGGLAEITKRSVEMFTEQADFFQRVRGNGVGKESYHVVGGKGQTHGQGYGLHSQGQNNNLYSKYLGEKDAMNNTDGIKKVTKEYLRLYKPTFFVYVEKYL